MFRVVETAMTNSRRNMRNILLAWVLPLWCAEHILSFRSRAMLYDLLRTTIGRVATDHDPRDACALPGTIDSLQLRHPPLT